MSSRFEPIDLRRKVGHSSKELCGWFGCIEWFCSDRKYINGLINQFIRVKPEILKEVNSFVKKNFPPSSFLIGIHYRGGDKNHCDCARVSYENVKKKIQMFLKNRYRKGRNYVLFLASDEKDFYEYMGKAFPGHCVFFSRGFEGGFHEGIRGEGYLEGKKALVDCLLLSKTNVIIRTVSNLSLVSTFFNPDIPVFCFNNVKG